MSRKSSAKPPNPIRYLNSSPAVIRLAVMMNVKYPLSLRNVEDLLADRGIDICHQTALSKLICPLFPPWLAQLAGPRLPL